MPFWVKSPQNRNDRIGALYKAWGHVINSNMGGAYYEFGIYKGSSFRESFLAYQQYVIGCTLNPILRKNGDKE